MSNSSVFWKMFTVTGGVGPYLLYKYTNGNQMDKNDNINNNEEQEKLGEVASERG